MKALIEKYNLPPDARFEKDEASGLWFAIAGDVRTNLYSTPEVAASKIAGWLVLPPQPKHAVNNY